MFSISNWVNKLFEEYDNALPPLIMLGIVGFILFLSIWLGETHLTIPAPYWQIIVWTFIALYFIAVEWMYIDTCIRDKHESIIDYLASKGFALIITAMGLPVVIIIVGFFGAMIVGIVALVWEILKYFSVNTHTLKMVLLVIGIIVAYLGINVLIGRAVKKDKKIRGNKNGKD